MSITVYEIVLKDFSLLRHWKAEYLDQNILLLTLDVQGRSTNVLTTEVMNELKYIVLKVAKNYWASLGGIIIRSGKQNGFIYGADVEKFQKVKTAKEAEKLALFGQKVFSQLEQIPVPTVAVINGVCVGGGLELALACKYRMAEENATLGLPEVLLGIHPGFGGTVRLPKLVGDSAALKMMLTGKNMRAKEAEKIGLVDEVVPERRLLDAGVAFIKKQPEKKKNSLIGWIGWLAEIASLAAVIGWWLGLPIGKLVVTTACFFLLWKVNKTSLVRKIIAGKARRETAKKANPKHYPAPHRIIKLWKNQADYAEEAKSLGEMLISPTSRNLVRLFLTKERLKKEARQTPHGIKRVQIVGAGVMGAEIATQCASRGFITGISDQSTEAVGKAIKTAREFCKKKLKDPRKIRETMDNLIPDLTGEFAKKADLIIEAVKEDAEVKRNLFKKLEQIVSPNAIFATNTSGIPLEEIAESLSDPSRLVGLHFFNPPTKMEVVEVVKGKNTGENAFNRAKSFTAALDRIPISVKSSPGFLINRCLFPYLFEAMKLAEEGAPFKDIDASAVAFGMPMGPIELMDMVGLEVCLLVADELIGTLGNSAGLRQLKKLVEEKKFGKKTEKGFYDYKDGKKITARKGKVDYQTAERLIRAVIQESERCLEEGIVENIDELNIGMVYGTGFAPFLGGPILRMK